MWFLEHSTNLSQLFYLLCGHALADYVLQTERMATLKHPDLKDNSPGCRAEYGPWWWWMTAHALINGLFVGVILHWWLLGVAEALVHGMADYAKCRGKLTVWSDQLVHLGSKVVWMGVG